MDEWCRLVISKLENQQATSSVAVSESDNSSLKSTLKSIQALIIDKNNDKAAGNSAIINALSADNMQVHRSQLLDNEYNSQNWER